MELLTNYNRKYLDKIYKASASFLFYIFDRLW